jgi:hypothetical protein
VYVISDIFTSIANRFGPAETRRVHIQITWH